jgi:hypothetical protein
MPAIGKLTKDEPREPVKAAGTRPENNMRYLARHGERKKRAAIEGLDYREGIDGLRNGVGLCWGAS